MAGYGKSKTFAAKPKNDSNRRKCSRQRTEKSGKNAAIFRAPTMSICARQQGERRWHDVGRALSVRGSTVLVVGTGDIGSHFASICKAMGANTLGVRRDPTRTAEGIDRMYRIGERKALCSRRTSDESPALNG